MLLLNKQLHYNNCPRGPAVLIVTFYSKYRCTNSIHCSVVPNDLTMGWQNLYLLSHPNATLAPQARQAWASGENLNYETLVQQAR